MGRWSGGVAAPPPLPPPASSPSVSPVEVGQRQEEDQRKIPGEQACFSSSSPVPGPWAFSLGPLGHQGWVAGMLPEQAWGPAWQDPIPCQRFPVSPKAKIAVLGHGRQEACEGAESQSSRAVDQQTRNRAGRGSQNRKMQVLSHSW